MAILSTLLATGTDGRWHPGIGDPSVIGWVTVVAYFIAALLCFRALLLHLDRARTAPNPRDERLLALFWGLLLCAMLVFGVNKQLDLQTWFTEVARDLAKRDGWYEVRRRYQVVFIMVIGLVGFTSTVAVALLLRHVLHRVLGAVIGLGALATFVVVRAASFHHIDLLLGRGPVRLNWVLELGGITCVAVSAWRQKRLVRARLDRPSIAPGQHAE